MKFMSSSVPKEERTIDPVKILRKMEIGTLRKILTAPDTHLTPQTFDKASTSQLSRIKHLLVSCSAAEAMGVERNINPDVAYSCALVRQLGLTLVAFNYPRIYGQAVASLKTDKDDIEKILKKILGFSPTQIGIKLALGWNRNTQLQMGLGNSGPLSEDDDPLMAYRLRDVEHKNGEELRKICEISESLARLNAGEVPFATSKSWDLVKAQIKGYLGADGLQIISDKVGSYQSEYVNLSEELFKTEILEKPAVASTGLNSTEDLYAENTFVRNCHGNLRGEFEQVYLQILLGEISPDAVNSLVGKVIPLAGFTKGCIYLADPKRFRLLPTVRIGRANISEYKILNYADAGKRTHPVIDALNSASPLRQEDAFVNGEIVSIIAGMFGNETKSGVLYLEMGKELARSDRTVSILYFKAIRQCLNHCLNLG